VRPPGEGAPAARLLLRPPDLVIGIAVTAMALAWLLLYIFALTRGSRRHGEEEDAAPAQAPWWRRIASVLVFLPYVLLAYLVWHSGSALPDLITRLAGELARLTNLQPARELPVASSPLLTWAVAMVILVVALGSLGVVLLILFGDRNWSWWEGSLPDHPPAPLVEAVEESLDDLRREPDPRVAIIKCYRHFEKALARSRLPRAPWQTPLEFMREALSRRALPPGAVRSLTELFELSRFSDQPLGRAERDGAWESLLEIQASLVPSEAGRRPVHV
jgi:hypothetical protein